MSVVDLEKVAKQWSRKRKEEASRTAGFWGGFAIPTVGGRYGKKKLVSPFQGQRFKKVSDLTRHAQPGDLLMVSHGAKPFDPRKAFISLGTGLPHGYHAAVVAEVRKQKGEIEILDLTIRGYKRKTIRTSSVNNYSLFRIEDPSKRRLVVDNMQRLVNTQRGLNKALERHGMSKKAINKVNRAMYADTLNPVIGVRELFVPYVRDRGVHNANYLKKAEREFKFVASNIEGIAKDMADYWKKTGKIDTTHLKPMQRICTSIAAAVGVPVGRTSNPKWSGPNDLLRSGKLKPIGYKVSPKYNKFVGAYEALLKAAPNLIRGAAGVALGGFFAGSIAAKHAIKRKTEQRKARQVKQRRLKRQIRVKGHMRKNKYVKSHTKTADAYERQTMDDLQDSGYARGLNRASNIMELIKVSGIAKHARPQEDAYNATNWNRSQRPKSNPRAMRRTVRHRDAAKSLRNKRLAEELMEDTAVQAQKKRNKKGLGLRGRLRVAPGGFKSLIERGKWLASMRRQGSQSFTKKTKTKNVVTPPVTGAPEGAGVGSVGSTTGAITNIPQKSLNISLKAGQGYGVLAKQLKAQGVNVGTNLLRKRMGGQMLHPKAYTFNKTDFSTGNTATIAGGSTAKTLKKNIRRGLAWRSKPPKPVVKPPTVPAVAPKITTKPVAAVPAAPVIQPFVKQNPGQTNFMKDTRRGGSSLTKSLSGGTSTGNPYSG